MANSSKSNRSKSGRGSSSAKQPAPSAAKQPVDVPQPVQAGMDVYDKVVWYCLHALLILVPIAMSNLTFLGIGNGLPLTYDQFDIAKVFVMRAVTLVALGVWGWKMLMRGGQLRRTKVDWIIVAFLAWVLLTTLTSISPATAVWGKYRRFEGLLSFINYAAVFFLTVQMVDRPSRIRSLAQSLLIGGVIVCFYGLLQAVGVDPIKWGALPFEVNRSFSTYGNPDLLGGYLMFPLPIAVGLWMTERQFLKRFFYGLALLLVVIVWITAFVRGAWIGGAVALLILFAAAVWMMRKGEIGLREIDGAIAALLVGGAGMFVYRSMRTDNPVMNIGRRLASIFEFGEGSARTRFEIWEAAWSAVKARPITGWGADTFRLVFPKFKPVEYTKDAGYLSVADNVHNYPLQLASGIGIPGLLLLYVGVLGTTLVLSLLAILRKASGPTRYLLFAFWAAAVGYITHLNFGLSVTGSTVILWFALGVLISPIATSREVRPPSWGTIAAILLVAVLAFASIYNVVFMVADNHYLNARISGQYNPELHVAEAKAAVGLNPFNDMYRAEVGIAYQDVMFTYLQQATQSTGEQQQQAIGQSRQAFEQATASLKDTIAFVPSEYDNYVFLADLYNKAGAYFDPKYFNDALDISLKAIKDVEPFGPAIRYQAAQAHIGLKQYDQALKQLDTAIAQDPAYADPWLLKAEALRSQGKIAEAKAALEKAIAVSTNEQLKQVAQQGLQSLEASVASPSVPTTKQP